MNTNNNPFRNCPRSTVQLTVAQNELEQVLRVISIFCFLCLLSPIILAKPLDNSAQFIESDSAIPIIETLTVAIETATDDAEENLSDGDVFLFSSDLELIQNKLQQQTVALRFALDIPTGASILNANIQFTTDEISSVPTVLSVSAEATAHALTFSNLKFDISNRPLITASIPWTPAPWILYGEAGPHQATPDLSTIVQQIVGQEDWEQGNSIAFIISGKGMRGAESFDGTAPPVLQVIFSTVPPASKAPVAIDDDAAKAVAYTTAVDQQLIVPDGVNDLVERNDIVGFPVAEVSSADVISDKGGNITVRPDGSFSYTPKLGFVGVDSFTYTLENTVGSDSATVYIRVEPIVDILSLSLPVKTGSDDAEENVSDGLVTLKSGDLELIKDGASPQQVGIRFQDLAIPQGATINTAFIQYTTDETSSQTTEVTIFGQSSSNALTFSVTSFDISSRPVTSASEDWTPSAWNTLGAAGLNQKTPDLSAIVQEIVNQNDWVKGNAIAFITTGSGKRVAESFEGLAPPVLHVSYSIELPEPYEPIAEDDGSNDDPAYTVGINQKLTVPNGPSDIVERNDTVGFPVAGVYEYDSTAYEGGTVTGYTDGSFSYTPAEDFLGIDMFSYYLSNSEGDRLSSAYVYIEVKDVTPLSIPVIIGSDDAEQDISTGEMYLTSSDLEMIMVGESIQLVGVRFQSIAVPPGAIIKNAYIQYTSDEVSTKQTILTVSGEVSANAMTFNNTDFNISDRPLTTARIKWTPPPWNIKGSAGPEQATPDLSSIVQEIVDQDDWLEENSMAFIISGNGNRVAESINGTAAPVLYLEYSLPPVLNSEDSITVSNSFGDVRLLVDGQSSSTVVNDKGYTGRGLGPVYINVGELSSSSLPNRNEAISFGKDRAPQRSAMAWTSGKDDFSMSLGDRLSIPVTIWIVQGPFEEQSVHAANAIFRTSAIWDAEHMGIQFSQFEIRDATSDPDINDAILNSTGGNNRNWDDFSNNIGFVNGRINVYWINTVEGRTTTGWSDFGSRIVMGLNTGDELLVHELGHALSLRHPASCGGLTTKFDYTNVMWPCSNNRQFLSEGQVFRAHFNSSSVINNLYHARPGQATVECIGSSITAECPELHRRLWDDGNYPAN